MDVFLARQPILDTTQRLRGYELLFRSGPENAYPGGEQAQTTSRVLDTVMTTGLDTITAGAPAFINFPADLVVAGQPVLLPADAIVVELLEDVEPDAEVVAACRRLKDLGYRIALDDFADRDDYGPLIDLADIVKVDFTLTSPAQQRRLAERFTRRSLQLLAEKVDHPDDVARAKADGYTLFQGYYFARPKLLPLRDITALNATRLQLLEHLQRDELDYDHLERVLRQDPALVYKLLSYVNAAAFGLRHEITSVRQGLVFVGEDNLRRWASLVILALLTDDHPAELAITSAVRANYCEALAPLIGMPRRGLRLFLVGMLSLLDVIFDRPMPQALATMPLSDDVRAALLGEENELRLALDLVIAHERADWERLRDVAATLGVDQADLPALHYQALGAATGGPVGTLLGRRSPRVGAACADAPGHRSGPAAALR
ncbi:MAG TPA: HDOD domain-containing protein [Egibacteraceae bacterium]